MNKHLASIMGLTLLGVFLLSSIWEFWLEDLFYLSMSLPHEAESLKTKWEFVFSAVSFSGLAMIIPAILTLRSQSQQQESEKKFRSLVSHMPGAVYRCACDSDWTMSFISKSIEEISGYPASDFIQNAKRSYASIIHPDDTKYVEDNVLQAVKKQEPFVLDYRILYKDCEVRWVFEKGQGIFDDKGNLQYLDGVILDVTEHKLTELALHKSEERLKLAMAGAKDGLWDWNVATGEVHYSPRWMTMLGYAPNELESKFETWEKLVHPDDKEPALKMINDYLNGNIPNYEIEHRLRAKNGNWKWILSRAKVFERDPQGKPLRMTGTHIDITEKKTIEEKLQASEELARILFTQLSSIVAGTAPATSGEDFFQSLVYHLAAALKVNYVFINETTDHKNKFRTLAYCNHGKIVDNIEYDIAGTPCESAYNGQAAIFPEKVLEKFPEDVYAQELKIESYLGLPLMDDSGKVIGLLGVMDNKPIADVDNVRSILSIFASRAGAELQRRDAKERLSKKAVELERVNKELQDFASIASHDLQEPLRKIIILGDRLESTIQNSNEKGRDYLVRMQNSASKMQNFIQDLLQYTKVGTKDRNLELVDLKEIAKNIVNELEHRLAETKGTVNMNGLPVIEADAFQMNQLFLNLIGNGLKFHRDGVPPVIDISCVKGNNGFWEIFVEDNGIGIDEKYVDKIFKPFTRLHGQDTYQGTGIGLTICNKILTGHGGTIAVKRPSSPHGVIFHIILPEKPHTETI